MLSKRLARGLIFALCLLSPFSIIPGFKALGMIQIRDGGTITQPCYGYGYAYGNESCTTTTSITNSTANTTTTPATTPTTKTSVSVIPQQSSSSAVNASRCVIATAAYGSELAGPVQFLRDFRDKEVNETYLGNNFLTAFNAWYYSWAPSVAKEEYANGYLRSSVRVAILPLLGSLMIASTIFQLIHPVNPELAVLATGLMASALLGLIYLTPLVFAAVKLKKARLTRRSLFYAALFGIVLTMIGTLGHGTYGILEILPAFLVIEITILSPLTIVKMWKGFGSRRFPAL